MNAQVENPENIKTAASPSPFRIETSKVDELMAQADLLPVWGRVTRATGLVVHAVLPGASLGTACEICVKDGRGQTRMVGAEVIGVDAESCRLMPVGDLKGIREGDQVRPLLGEAKLRVSNGLLGRVVNANLEPIDEAGDLAHVRARTVPLKRPPPSVMARKRIDTPMDTQIRVVDTLLTLGEGQRIGIFAGAGVGKSVLLGMLAKMCRADVIVLGLVGERGREVREFVERDLGEEGRARSVVIVATGDEAPLVRVRAAHAAHAVAEAFRDEGKRVLLLLDSLTRVAMAWREVGLAGGEPPTSKGYPPSVFTSLWKLTERAGCDRNGSITAIYTVLAEGDDMSDPVADAARSSLDGHWVLSRALAGAGHFPAVKVTDSVSRVMSDIATKEAQEVARRVRADMAILEDAKTLIEVGAYQAGQNPALDAALARQPKLERFLKQAPLERSSRAQSEQALAEVFRA